MHRTAILERISKGPPEETSISKIAHSLKISSETVSKAVKKFEATGLITRTIREEKHRRRTECRLTDRGIEVLGLVRHIGGGDLEESSNDEPDRNIVEIAKKAGILVSHRKETVILSRSLFTGSGSQATYLASDDSHHTECVRVDLQSRRSPRN